jgi:phosphopantothenoylcysteine decarboxylase / phosphopantothenate---cysteine ligase
MDLTGKTIALAIPGGIAAYRACDLIRELYRRNAHRVIPILTPKATEFVAPLTLQALSREKVYVDDLAVDETGVPIHIALAQQADILVVMPATANILAKMAHGLADDIITTTFITFTHQPVLIVPAMNTRMWNHPITQRNLETLISLPNTQIVAPASGLLACGEVGDGHLADAELVLQWIYKLTHPHQHQYQGKKALVTAGGTQEAIDPVRFITNQSSGKMGLALADELFAMGAQVHLITTKPPAQPRPYPIIHVKTADEMKTEAENLFPQMDCLFMAAAVSDFSPLQASPEKIKRAKTPTEASEPFTLALQNGVDILATLSKQKQAHQVVVGFAAESEHLFQHAREKLERKNLDLIVANDISRSDIGFDSPDNEVILLFKDKSQVVLAKQPKFKIAQEILIEVSHRFLNPSEKKVPLPETPYAHS